MFGYVSLGTNDLPRALAFWDAVMAALGHARADHDAAAGHASWGGVDPATHLWVTRPFDGRPATPGNGTMISFRAARRAQVDAFHAAALGHGGSDEGKPGLRPHYGPDFYAAYVRDPDGNKINAVCHDPQGGAGG